VAANPAGAWLAGAVQEAACLMMATLSVQWAGAKWQPTALCWEPCWGLYKQGLGVQLCIGWRGQKS
jgi:hypothetical protein